MFKDTSKHFENIESNVKQMITRYSTKKSSSSFEPIVESVNNNLIEIASN